jgi:hypothetical protein
MELTITHQTANTEFVGADGVAYAYRRFGRPSTSPLVFLQHFRGNLDNWDPAFTDALAAEREIILVDPPGVGASTGAPKHTVAETARAMLAFLDVLDLREIDPARFLARRLRRAGACTASSLGNPPADPCGYRAKGRSWHARLAQGHRRRHST